MTISLCASPMNFSMQIAHLNGEPRSSALCFQAADTSGESKKKKKPELFASVSLAESSFVGVCGPADGSLQLSGPNRRRKPQTLGIHSELIPLQIVRNRGCFSVRYKVMSVRTV